MQILKERTEIAKAINFGKYPVIKIDLSDRDEYGIKGTKVRIDNGTFKSGEAYFINATIRAFSDEKILTISQGCGMLVDRLTYADYMEMIEYANAPIIKANQEILIFVYNSVTKAIYHPVIIKTGNRVDAHCSTPLELEKYTVL